MSSETDEHLLRRLVSVLSVVPSIHAIGLGLFELAIERLEQLIDETAALQSGRR